MKEDKKLTLDMIDEVLRKSNPRLPKEVSALLPINEKWLDFSKLTKKQLLYFALQVERNNLLITDNDINRLAIEMKKRDLL